MEHVPAIYIYIPIKYVQRMPSVFDALIVSVTRGFRATAEEITPTHPLDINWQPPN